MAGFEDLIRTTLQKQGDPTPERRAKIYESSRQALERMLGQNASLDEAAAQSQRDRLDQAIDAIEADYRAQEAQIPSSDYESEEGAASPIPSGAPPTGPPGPVPQSREGVDNDAILQPSGPADDDVQPTGLVPPPQPRLKSDFPPEVRERELEPEPVAPDVSLERQPVADPRMDDGLAGLSARREGPGDAPSTHAAPPAPAAPAGARLEPQFDVDIENDPPMAIADDTDVSADYDGPILNERRPYAKLLLWAIILAGIGTAIWWAITFGPELLKAQFDGSVRNPPARIETGSFVPEDQGGWVSVFAPDTNADKIDTGDGGRAELVRVDGRDVARIASTGDGDDTTIRIEVPRGVMESLRGKAATFELQIAGGSGESHQFAVYCRFGDMGECGRKRFRARERLEPYLFDMLVNDASLGDGETAHIAIDTDIGEGGQSLDLYSIRVRSGG